MPPDSLRSWRHRRACLKVWTKFKSQDKMQPEFDHLDLDLGWWAFWEIRLRYPKVDRIWKRRQRTGQKDHRSQDAFWFAGLWRGLDKKLLMFRLFVGILTAFISFLFAVLWSHVFRVVRYEPVLISQSEQKSLLLLPALITGVYNLLIINFNISDTVSTQFSSSYFLNNKH